MGFIKKSSTDQKNERERECNRERMRRIEARWSLFCLARKASNVTHGGHDKRSGLPKLVFFFLKGNTNLFPQHGTRKTQASKKEKENETSVIKMKNVRRNGSNSPYM